MFHDLETVEGFGECPPHVRCKKCGKVAMAPDEFGSDCDVVVQFAQKTLAQRTEERIDATIPKRLDEKKTMEIQNVEKLTWEVEVEPDGDSAWVRLRVGEKREAYLLATRRFFGTLKAAIDRAKNKILLARNLAKAESGSVYVPYQPRK